MLQTVSDYLTRYPYVTVGIALLFLLAWISHRINRTLRSQNLPAMLREMHRFQSDGLTKIFHDFFTYHRVSADFMAVDTVHRIELTPESLRSLLRPAGDGETFSAEEIIFRRAFNEYLSNVAGIAQFLHDGMADKTLIRQHIGIFIQVAGKAGKKGFPEATVQAIHNYLIDNQHSNITRVLVKFGYLTRLNYDRAAYPAKD